MQTLTSKIQKGQESVWLRKFYFKCKKNTIKALWDPSLVCQLQKLGAVAIRAAIEELVWILTN